MFSIIINPRCTAAMASSFHRGHLSCVIAFARERGRWRMTRSTWLDDTHPAGLERERVIEEARLALVEEMLLRQARRGARWSWRLRSIQPQA